MARFVAKSSRKAKGKPGYPTPLNAGLIKIQRIILALSCRNRDHVTTRIESSLSEMR
jgi:hypothetical protein